MRLRGIDQTRINITLDGIPLNDPEDHFVYFSNFPDLTNSLRSVELQRGVGASSNGVASYAGSLTMESVSLAGAQRGGELQLERGSFDSNRGSIEYATGLLPSKLSFYGRVLGAADRRLPRTTRAIAPGRSSRAAATSATATS